MMADDEILTQLSIFVNNEPGRLAAVAGILKECGVNMKACNLAESNEFGILRAIVDDPDDAYERIKSKGLIVRKTDIVGISIDNVPGSLFEAADVLGKAGINIDYGYAYASKDREGLFIRVDDPMKAAEVLKSAGIDIIRRSEI
jgi:hypothetical protein